MGEVNNLQQQEAVNKIRELVKNNAICLFCTKLEKQPFETRPMSVQDVDDEGNLWFLSDKNSNKNQEIKQDDSVQLLFANNGNSEYMSIYGSADVFYDRSKVEELWNPIAKAWFTEGKDDPRISVIRVRAKQGYYWDTQNGKMVDFLKMLAGAVTGKTMDGGVEGTLNA
ncbi:MAG: pyridoxamine 5'-phosphate oxidase family protein [Bacteroidetes bacterium]|nr:pyridoxamine 5'-phosphate oxidase family protein [Bacteroidota bacterium]